MTLPVVLVRGPEGHPLLDFAQATSAPVDVVAMVHNDGPEISKALRSCREAGLVAVVTDPTAAIRHGLDSGRPMLVATRPGRWCDSLATPAIGLSETISGGWLPDRWDPESASVAATLDSGVLGQIVAVRVVRTTEPGFGFGSEGSLTRVADLATLWTGDSPEGVASLQSGDQLGDSAPTFCATIRFAKGATALIEAGEPSRYGGLGFRETLIVGTDGTLEIPWDPVAASTTNADGLVVLRPEPPEEHLPAAARPLHDWAEAVMENRQPRATGNDLLQACRVAWVARRSAKHGGKVLGLDPNPDSIDQQS